MMIIMPHFYLHAIFTLLLICDSIWLVSCLSTIQDGLKVAEINKFRVEPENVAHLRVRRSATDKPINSSQPTSSPSLSLTTIRPSTTVTAQPKVAASTTNQPKSVQSTTRQSKSIPSTTILTKSIQSTTVKPISTTNQPKLNQSTAKQPVQSTTIQPKSIKSTTTLPKSTTTTTANPAATRSASTTIQPTPVNANITKRVGSSRSLAANSNATSLITTNQVHYDARDVTYFLEGHLAHSLNDPRVYFTEERTTKSLAVILNELNKIPEKARFAYFVRTFNELGRKIASKLNYCGNEVAAILKKTPDDLGNKPEVSMLVDVVNNIFESKEDKELREDDSGQVQDDMITKLIHNDKEKAAVFDSSIDEISKRLARLMTEFANRAMNSTIKIPENQMKRMITLISESMKMGGETLITELSSADKFRITKEMSAFMDRIFNKTLPMFESLVSSSNRTVQDSLRKSFEAADAKSFSDLSQISASTGLIGAWNSYLFTNLGSSERVIKLFASLLSRVPPEAKSRWINMYVSQVDAEVERTLSGFVLMQGMPFKSEMSQKFLLEPVESSRIMPVKVPAPRQNYTADKNRMPARCYLAGRRWRLILTRALKGYPDKDKVINRFVELIGKLKLKLSVQNGNEVYRLCMPRVEVGLRGWGINGEPQDGNQMNKFPLKNPIEDLSNMPDPFTSGVKLGYKIGFKLGYNEERNATLEIEKGGSKSTDMQEKIKSEVDFLSKASYRKAATAGAKASFDTALREGYMSTLKISMRAGMMIPVEFATKIASLKCASLGDHAGQEAGKSVAETLLAGKTFDEKTNKYLTDVGKTYGSLGGKLLGGTIGAIVGREAAQEAYRRGIVRGGKTARAKFHLDEYQAGSKYGFEFGLKEGKKVASSSTLDPSAPRFFHLPIPGLADEDNPENQVDLWEKDLIPPLSDKILGEFHDKRNHTTVSGSLKGSYKFAKEVKKGFDRVSYSNMTLDLEVFADGFIVDDIAYLTLNGTVNKMGNLRGSLIAKDIFNDAKDS